MAVTRFVPAKPHEVKVHWRLAAHRLKLVPYAAQRFDRSQTTSGIGLEVATSWQSFSYAPVVVVADGKTIGRFEESWAVGTSWTTTQQTVIENPAVVRAISNAKEVYITILFDGRQTV